MFEDLYADPVRLELFTGAMTGISMGGFAALAEKHDFSRYQTVCDIGGATGLLSIMLARRYPHLRCTTFDLPVVEPIAQRTVAAAGLGDRVSTASGDFFVAPLPAADVITMGMILHDWKLALIRAGPRRAASGRRADRDREPHRRRPARERGRADDVADHAHRVRRRLRFHRCRLPRLVRGGRLSFGGDPPDRRTGIRCDRLQVDRSQFFLM